MSCLFHHPGPHRSRRGIHGRRGGPAREEAPRQERHGVSFTEAELARGKVVYNFRTEDAFVEDLPGISSFLRDEDGRIYHTYSTYARGCEPPIGAYAWLDYAPKGRDEDELAFTMSWVRHHDRYGADYALDAAAGYRPPEGAGTRSAD